MSKQSIAAVLILSMLPASVVIAGEEPKRGKVVGGVTIQIPKADERPWLLGLDTRLELRFNRDSGEGRLRATTGQEGPQARDVIDGRKNPELLLPWEIHRFLLSTAFYRDEQVASAWRRRFQAATPSLGITDDFWRKLNVISSDYLRLKRDSEAASAGSALGANDAAAKAECHSRMLALHRANIELGTESFYKFLYLSVAPAMKVSGANAISADRHRYISRGCE